jgi:HSP20 family protein
MAARGLKDLAKREKERTFPVSPFYDIDRWFDEMWNTPMSMFRPSLFADTDLLPYNVSPTVDIYEEGNDMVLKAELPGMKKEDIKIDLAEHVLTISGEKSKTEKIERKDYYRNERTYGSFCRRFEMPADLDTEKIKAHFEDGILEVRIPMLKEAEKKHRKIAIN